MKYFSYSPDFAFEFHNTAEEARAAAQNALDELREESPDGWSPDVDLICWGEVKQLATMTNKRPAEPGSEFEYMCDYELVDQGDESEVSASSSPGAFAIAQERQRQISGEGWSAEHDDQHTAADMLDAARCYIIAADACDHPSNCVTFADGFRPGEGVPRSWPWAPEWWKPKDALSNLRRAGALVAADYDRRVRAKMKGGAEANP